MKIAPGIHGCLHKTPHILIFKLTHHLFPQMLAYQIEQLKEDISGKEVGLRSTEASLSKCNKRVEALRVEVQGGVARLADAKAENTALRQEEGRLNRIIQVGCGEREVYDT